MSKWFDLHFIHTFACVKKKSHSFTLCLFLMTWLSSTHTYSWHILVIHSMIYDIICHKSWLYCTHHASSKFSSHISSICHLYMHSSHALPILFFLFISLKNNCVLLSFVKKMKPLSIIKRNYLIKLECITQGLNLEWKTTENSRRNLRTEIY